MTRVQPFRALRYDPKRVELSKVLVPPYDVVAGDERERFYEQDPHNAIRFELTRNVDEEAATDYADVRRTLEEWEGKGVLRRDEEPGFYVMRQRFVAPTGESLERVGFFGALGLEEYSAGIVRPHERTLSGPKADRLKVLRAARANLSPVFLLYEDRDQALAGTLAHALETGVLGEARDAAGVAYTLAALRTEAECAAIREFLSTRPVVIADGHHRYETALAYRKEQRAAGAEGARGFESTLAYFANAWAPGSLLLPIHRVIRKAPVPTEAAWRERLLGWQRRVIEVSDADAIPAALAEHLAPLADRDAFVADDGSKRLQLFWRESAGDDLVVEVVEREVIGGVFGLSPEAIREGAVSFPKSAERAARDVRSGEGTVALYVNALTADDVFRTTEAGRVMPQKSTFFHPKVPTGLVFRVHDA